MKVYIKKTLSAAVFAASVALLGCDNETNANYDAITTYTFSNVDYSDASKRLAMIAQIESLMNTGNVSGGGSNIDGTKLKNMFTNTDNPFSADSLNNSGLQLEDQAITASQAALEAYLASQATISASTDAAKEGTAGVGTTKANTYILLTEDGHNNRQLFTKTVMSSLLSHQIIALTSSTLDNTTVVAGKGTAMEHAWDLAFGYFSVPKDFPTNVTGVKYLGSYSNQVNPGLGSNSVLMDAFRRGRAAISNKDMKTKSSEAAVIATELEALAAAAAIHEIGEAKASLDDDIQRVSRLSECMGFVLSLKYFENRTITDTQVDTIVSTYFHNGDLYDVTIDDMNNLVTNITTIYGFTTPDKI